MSLLCATDTEMAALRPLNPRLRSLLETFFDRVTLRVITPLLVTFREVSARVSRASSVRTSIDRGRFTLLNRFFATATRIRSRSCRTPLRARVRLASTKIFDTTVSLPLLPPDRYGYWIH